MIRPQLLIPLAVLLAGWHVVQSEVRWSENGVPLPHIEHFANIAELESGPDEETEVSRAKRGAPDFRRKLWNRDALPYIIDARYSDDHKKLIRDNLQTFIDNTCITFKENYNDGSGLYLEYVKGKDNAKCDSEVGDMRRGTYNTETRLPATCISRYTIQHETMHALGFRHTHCRHDRDEYLSVDLDDISSAQTRKQYLKLDVENTTTTYGIPYEYSSIMHYYGIVEQKWVMTARDEQYNSSLGGFFMLFNDWKLINLHYGCDSFCPTRITCKNGGYQHPRQCEKCVCSQFFQGTYCEEEIGVINIVTDERLPFGTKTELDWAIMQQEIENFDEKTVHTIKAPVGKRIRVAIDYIDDPYGDKHDRWRRDPTCVMFALEIVDADLTRGGKRFCMYTSIGQTVLSKSNVMGIVVFQSPGHGFGVNVTITVEDGSGVVPTETPTTLSPTTTKAEETTTVAPVTEPVTEAPQPTTTQAPESTTTTEAPQPTTTVYSEIESITAPRIEPVTEDTVEVTIWPKTTAPMTQAPSEEPITDQPPTEQPVPTTTDDGEGDYWCKKE